MKLQRPIKIAHLLAPFRSRNTAAVHFDNALVQFNLMLVDIPEGIAAITLGQLVAGIGIGECFLGLDEIAFDLGKASARFFRFIANHRAYPQANPYIRTIFNTAAPPVDITQKGWIRVAI